MQVFFILNDGQEKIVEAQAGATLLDVISENGIPVIGVCSGSGVCASCQVKIAPESAPSVQPPSNQELDVLEMFQADDGVRLACQVTLTEQNDGLRVILL
jgi:2Fe-2S ferredoxin